MKKSSVGNGKSTVNPQIIHSKSSKHLSVICLIFLIKKEDIKVELQYSASYNLIRVTSRFRLNTH